MQTAKAVPTVTIVPTHVGKDVKICFVTDLMVIAMAARQDLEERTALKVLVKLCCGKLD